MSPSFGALPVLGPEVVTLYCRPEAVVTTPGALAFLARKAWPSARVLEVSTAADSCGGAEASCANTGLDSRERARTRPEASFIDDSLYNLERKAPDRDARRFIPRQARKLGRVP